MTKRARLSKLQCPSRNRDRWCLRILDQPEHASQGPPCPCGDGPRDGPSWDDQTRILRLGPHIVKRFTQPAPDQEAILAAFEEAGWPRKIDDPLPPKGKIGPKQRLRATIRGLNGHQKKKVIRFFGDGTGEGICWVGVCRAISAQDDVPASG